MNPKSRKTAMDCALGYLTTRMRSKYEMQIHLTQKGYTVMETDETLARLCELRLIDDALFAEQLVHDKTAARPVGKRLLWQLLQQKGIEKEQIEQVLQGYSEQEENDACMQMFEKLARKHGTDRTGRLKIQRALIMRGFDYEAIRRASERINKGDDWE